MQLYSNFFLLQVDGSCSCLPGYEGDACEVKCGADTYGAGCGDTCSCGPGHVCHHVTGDCLRCEVDLYIQNYFS